MDNARWNQIVNDSETDAIAAMIPRTIVETALLRGDEHPVSKLINHPARAETRVTNQALTRIKTWLETTKGSPHRSWVEAKINKLNSSDAAEAASRLAELRALGTLLSTSGSPTDGLIPEPNPPTKGRSPDLRLMLTPTVYIEVCCARWNDDERAKQHRIDEAETEMLALAIEKANAAARAEPGARVTATATKAWSAPSGSIERHELSVSSVALEDGNVPTISTAHRVVQPQGSPKAESDGHALARSLSSKKPPGQVPSGSPGILWMDFCDPDWALRVANTRPVETEWKELPLATTRGVWHAFYGQKDKTPLFTRTAISLGLGDEMAGAFVQMFDARLRNVAHRGWSAAVLRCTDGVTIFESPDPLVPLPFPVLRELVGLEGYSPEMSFHRFSENDFDGLRARLDDVEKQLRFCIG